MDGKVRARGWWMGTWIDCPLAEVVNIHLQWTVGSIKCVMGRCFKEWNGYICQFVDSAVSESMYGLLIRRQLAARSMKVDGIMGGQLLGG